MILCYNCNQLGYKSNECPNPKAIEAKPLKSIKEEKVEKVVIPNPTSRAYMMATEEDKVVRDVVTGTIPINNYFPTLRIYLSSQSMPITISNAPNTIGIKSILKALSSISISTSRYTFDTTTISLPTISTYKGKGSLFGGVGRFLLNLKDTKMTLAPESYNTRAGMELTRIVPVTTSRTTLSFSVAIIYARDVGFGITTFSTFSSLIDFKGLASMAFGFGHSFDLYPN
ncbi:putative reverse transcriptase domain-containing protein [Tanacetum coccineum]